jgi:small-conductance mechanosensitive channel
VSEILDRATSQLGESLPRIAGALLVLVVGLLVAWLIGIVTRRTLRMTGIDGLADRYHVHRTLIRVGIQPPLSHLVGRVARIVLSIVVIFAALSLLGLAGLNLALNEALLFVPKLLVALALLLAGVIVGELVGRWVDQLAQQMAIEAPAGAIAQAVTVALFALTALAQIGVPTHVLLLLVAIVLVTAASTFTLAFGLGGRDIARQMSAGRYVHGAFELGQQITIANMKAEIVAFESAATVVRTEAGDTARVPNHVLLDSIVIVHAPDRE